MAARLPVLLFLGTVIAAILTIPGETVQIGPRLGPKTLVPKLPVQLGVLAVILPLTVIVVVGMGKGLHLLWTTRSRSLLPLRLEPGEAIAWKGRQGWYSIDRQRAWTTILAGAGPTLYAFWLWRIWSVSGLLVEKLFWTFFATVVLGGSVAVLLSAEARTLLNDLFGSMTITDRRIAWYGPRGELYRELRGTGIIGAAIVEGDARRAWITVTYTHRDRVTEIDLFGVPRPAEALRAIGNMMARSADLPVPNDSG